MYLLERTEEISYMCGLQKALHCCIFRALILYNKIKGELKDFGFLLNQSDACVDNKQITGIQMAVNWHVNDLKISHKDAGEVTNMITYLESIYGVMKVKRENNHTYLGMYMELIERGAIKVSMTVYIDEYVDDLHKDFTTTVVSPVAEYLFKISTSGKRLSEEQAILFHRLVAKLPFVSKFARVDIHPTIEFIITRVYETDADEWENI